MIRIDPGTDDGRFALEFSAVAHGLNLTVIWMKRQPTPHCIRRVFSMDGATTFSAEDWHAPSSGDGTPETDPMTAVDPETGDIWIGAKRGQKALFVSRRDLALNEWGEAGYAFLDDINAVDKCWMAAGPTPGIVPGDTRLYIASLLPGDPNLLWSDDLGETWVEPINANLGEYMLPRIGSAGELYIAHLVGSDFRIRRSVTRNGDADQSPLFITTDTTVVTYSEVHHNGHFPGNFRAPHIGCIAVHPEDGAKVFAVFAQKTSASGGNTNIDVYFTKTDDATATNGNGDDLVDWSTPTIVPAGIEVAGDQFFPWLEVTQHGADTRLHLIFFDTRNNSSQADSSTNESCLLAVYIVPSSRLLRLQR